jgi:type IV pilus assembly protein PilV
MVALVVISIGLLGVAKMQALALASTSVASARSLAAIQAASLAATMHENRSFWASTAPAANAGGILISAANPTVAPTITANAPLSTAVDCTSAGGPCDSPHLAAFDLQQWALAVQSVLPNYQATITCTAVSPVSCTITIVWTERAVALTAQEVAAQKAAGANYLQSPIYTLYVEP